MTEHTMIALCAFGFGVLTWLLSLSFLLGRYSARLDGIETCHAEIWTKLDAALGQLPHHCHQAERIARVEAEIDRMDD